MSVHLNGLRNISIRCRSRLPAVWLLAATDCKTHTTDRDIEQTSYSQCCRNSAKLCGSSRRKPQTTWCSRGAMLAARPFATRDCHQLSRITPSTTSAEARAALAAPVCNDSAGMHRLDCKMNVLKLGSAIGNNIAVNLCVGCRTGSRKIGPGTGVEGIEHTDCIDSRDLLDDWHCILQNWIRHRC